MTQQQPHNYNEDRSFVEREFHRMGFDKESRWRISDINKDFELCSTYPRYLILPSNFKDEDLDLVAKFRYFRRIPTAVWRHMKNGCFIVRSSQPTVGWFGWFRSELDENLVQAYVSNTVQQHEKNSHHHNHHHQQHKDQPTIGQNDDEDEICIGPQNLKINDNNDRDENQLQSPLRAASNNETADNSGPSTPPFNSPNGTDPNRVDIKKTSTPSSTPPQQQQSKTSTTTETSNAAETSVPTPPPPPPPPPPPQLTTKMLIIDARSYAAAMANRAKGGGCECSEYYSRCELHFMNLANIHSIRKSYHAIRSVCEAYSEQSNNWLNFLDNSRWLHHISGLIKSALLVVDAIDIDEKSVLIHCSDGWDRTPQLVALAEIMLDSHYRTFEGLKTLIQREWLDFGHKFADRCGSNPCNEDANERCPVFLQWLDCVQQLLVQYPKHFEFNSHYLDKLNRHTYSNVFGAFSYNSNQERILSQVGERMGSLWSYFESTKDKYMSPDYVKSDDILRPSYKVKDLKFWKEVYLPPLEQPNPTTTTNHSASPFIPITTTTPTSTTTTTATINMSASPSPTSSLNSTTNSSTSNNTTTTATNNLDNNKCSHDSLYIDGLTRTVCK